MQEKQCVLCPSTIILRYKTSQIKLKAIDSLMAGEAMEKSKIFDDISVEQTITKCWTSDSDISA